MRVSSFGSAVVCLAGIAALVPCYGQTKLLRFPDIRGDRVVFTYAGDLWTASTSGGTASRLTSHPGLELFAKFSPDGKWIAFTGQYDGDEQVYVIPATGGIPQQLTFYPSRGPFPDRWGYDNQVYGWTRDSKAVIFRSMREYFAPADSRLYTVSIKGGLPVALPMPKSGAGDISPDGKQVVYSPLARDFRTWKRYSGGWAQQLYMFDLASHSVERITFDPRCHRDPMWIADKIYFASDKDDTLNLYSYDPRTKQTQQITHSTKWDLRWPSTDHEGRIVYEMAGELNILDIATGNSTHLSIQVPSDQLATRPSRISAADRIESMELSPKGQRALIVARGDVFTVPIEKGPTRNLTHSSNAHDKFADWSPDGANIAYISDADGEDEVYLTKQDGLGKPEEITHGFHGMLFQPIWAPDGKRIAFSDKEGKLYVVSLIDKKVVEVARSPRGQMQGYTWSGDGGYLAFPIDEPSGVIRISIWGAADGKVHAVTDALRFSNNPAWDPGGNYLYFLGVREYQPEMSNTEFNFATNRNTSIMAIALHKDGKNLFFPESDEVTIGKADGAEKEDDKPGAKKDEKSPEKDGNKAEDKKAEDKKPEPLHIDFDGIEDRVVRVPLDAENYGNLTATKEYLVYTKSGAPYYGRDPYPKTQLAIYSLKDRKETVLVEKVDDQAVSRDGSKVLVRDEKSFKLYDVKPEGKASGKAVSTDGLMVDRVPQQEWRELFNEVYRRYRDYYYVPGMNGYDWNAIRDQYSALVDYVGHRSDLNYVLGEMVAELSTSHSYVSGGDFELPKRTPVALPGARLELDAAAGRYRIAEIYHGQNDEEMYRSPLTEVGVEVKEGDYILAIEGRDLTAKDNPYELLRGKADHPVQLTVNAKPTADGARTIMFRPITSETSLLYLKWVERNREFVSKATDGKVGYIHLPDMGENGIREFIKTYYPQLLKQALIVDDRGNGGGNISEMIIQRLSQPVLGTGYGRNDEMTERYPGAAFFGPKVCLISETSASDGDIFPYMFKQAGLGPLIGKRTWGGVVGITDHGPLIDGGEVFVPEFATGSTDGKYVIEGHGVDPDIEVENDPQSVINGKDPQLERAIAEIQKLMGPNPKAMPGRPPDPNHAPKR